MGFYVAFNRFVKKGGKGVLRRFQQLSSYRNETEIWNREEFPCLREYFQGVFQLQEGHRQLFTTPPGDLVSSTS